MTIRLLLVDDHAVVRSGLRILLESQPDLEILGEAGTAHEALVQVDQLRPDLVLMDIGLPGHDGIHCVGQLKPKYHDTQFVMLTAQNDPQKTFMALQAGATGYLLKTASPEKIAESVREVVSGGSPMSAAIARLVVQSFQQNETRAPELARLTKTEREILDDLEAGYAYKEIAARRFIDMSTVQSHIRHIYEKLEVHSRTEAVNKAFGRKKG